MRVGEEKGIRGGDASCVSSPLRDLEPCSSVGAADTSPGAPENLAALGLRGPLTTRRCAPRGPYCVATLLALRRPIGGVLGCLPSVPPLRYAPLRTPSADHALARRGPRNGQWCVGAPGAGRHDPLNDFGNDFSAVGSEPRAGVSRVLSDLRRSPWLRSWLVAGALSQPQTRPRGIVSCFIRVLCHQLAGRVWSAAGLND